MNKSELRESLDEILGNYDGAINKISFVKLKNDLTNKESMIIDNFYSKLIESKQHIEALEDKINDLDDILPDELIPIIYSLKISSKKHNENALRAIYSFYPES